MFDSELFERHVRERGAHFGLPLTVVEETGSTNDDALAAARGGASHGATFLAERQTRGRGRRGRHWHADPGTNLLFSVVVRLALPIDSVPALSLAAGLAVRSAIARALPTRDTADERVRLKWPNDVWLDQKKVAGVLSESHLQGEQAIACVVGVGINVKTASFPPEIASTATSLLLSGSSVTRERLLADALTELEASLRELARGGVAALHRDLSRFDALAGRPVRVDDVTGVAAGIDDAGRLLVRGADGALSSVAGGSVELLA